MSTKILFVDDEPEFIYPQVEALENEGYQVFVKSRLIEAIEILHRIKFDLIILDIIMPPENNNAKNTDAQDYSASGVELHHTIREKLKLHDVPIIFLSVVRDQNIRQKLRQMETKYDKQFRFLTKPSLPSELITEVKIALQENAK